MYGKKRILPLGPDILKMRTDMRIINGYVFSGEQVVSGSGYLRKNILVTGVLGTVRKWFVVQKYRDAVKPGMNFAVIALEHQDLVHYGCRSGSC